MTGAGELEDVLGASTSAVDTLSVVFLKGVEVVDLLTAEVKVVTVGVAEVDIIALVLNVVMHLPSMPHSRHSSWLESKSPESDTKSPSSILNVLQQCLLHTDEVHSSSKRHASPSA